ncbi:hypothetical protein NLG97_g7693 [Lecanicillium saksenae]|uniref:Uncharacterized protein n=1 Tax=Lecanicillium saksenae TaxID=468837 RepID=A0ACC1QMX6_9HYPO|nr:hypothetical protein NLG97_g7693 [Lecanicillium saksenae]
MVNYTLHPDDAMPEPQLYLPAFGMRDAQVADRLAAFFKRCGWEDMAENYKRKLWECFPNDDHESSDYLHTFISFSYRGGKPYLSVYMHSFEGGNWPALPNSPISFDRY